MRVVVMFSQHWLSDVGCMLQHRQIDARAGSTCTVLVAGSGSVVGIWPQRLLHAALCAMLVCQTHRLVQMFAKQPVAGDMCTIVRWCQRVCASVIEGDLACCM